MFSAQIHPVTAPQVERAIRLTYAQMMLNAVFAASTGGMFLIGFGLALGADNILLGWMTALPQLFVVLQLLAAYFIERGFSRKRMTVIFSLLAPLGWFLIAALPCFAPQLDTNARLAILIGIISLVTLSAQFAGNARGSWLGELIPVQRRARFFGYCLLYSGLVGAVFAVAEGRFLDIIQARGLFAFASLFLFGALFGLISAGLNFPQPDCPLPGGPVKPAFRKVLQAALHNRPLRKLALVHAACAMAGAVAGPFSNAYCLRDVGVSFFGLGILNAVGTAATLALSPVCGRLADRFGCRPIMVLGLLIMAPCGLIWLLIPPRAPAMAYACLPWTNAICGIGSAAFSVALSSMIYKVSRPEGRSAQFALYNVFVVLVSAPMSVLGGWLVSALEKAGWASVDLRLTFYLWMLFMFLAAWLARRLTEPESVRARTLVLDFFPNELARFWETSLLPFVSALIRFQLPARRRPEQRPPPAP